MHAATQFWVYQNPESELVSDLSTSLDEIFAFVGDGTTEQFNAVNMPPQYKENALRIVQLLQGVRSDKTDANANLNAVLELMAYGTTMRDFKNLLKAIKAIESQQRITRGPTCWQAYEEEIIELRKRLGELSG